MHLQDLLCLEGRHAELLKEFSRGSFTVNKKGKKFSALPIDQAHEQNNKCVKSDGGAIGLTENSSELLRWMVSGPEVARLLGEFEGSQEHNQNKQASLKHHEQAKHVQSKFLQHTTELCQVFEKMGNPFEEESCDLLVLDTRDVVSPEVASSIKNIQSLGEEQFQAFVRERLNEKSKSLFDTIPKNKLPLFSCPPKKTDTKGKQQVNSLKKNCALFSQLFISCQVRDGDHHHCLLLVN